MVRGVGLGHAMHQLALDEIAFQAHDDLCASFLGRSYHFCDRFVRNIKAVDQKAVRWPERKGVVDEERCKLRHAGV